MPEAVRVDEEARPGLRGADMAVGYLAEEAVVVASDVIVRLMLATTKAEGWLRRDLMSQSWQEARVGRAYHVKGRV